MKPSNSQPVQTFLDDIAALDDTRFRIVQKLREIVFTACPDVSERMIYGGIMFSLKQDLGGVFAYKKPHFL